MSIQFEDYDGRDERDYSEYDAEAERLHIAEVNAEAADQRAAERAEELRQRALDNDDYDLDAIEF